MKYACLIAFFALLPLAAQDSAEAQAAPAAFLNLCNRTASPIEVHYQLPSQSSSFLDVYVPPTSDCVTVTIPSYQGRIVLSGTRLTDKSEFSTAELIANINQPVWAYFFDKECSIDTTYTRTCLTPEPSPSSSL